LDKVSSHPIIVEHFYQLQGFKWLMDIVGALPFRTLKNRQANGRSSKWRSYFKLVYKLKKGGAFLIYPAGRLKLKETEVIGGASFVHSLLQEVPDVDITACSYRRGLG
jgi:hypothetical protein